MIRDFAKLLWLESRDIDCDSSRVSVKIVTGVYLNHHLSKCDSSRVHVSVEQIGDVCNPNPVQYFHCIIQSNLNPVVLSKYLTWGRGARRLPWQAKYKKMPFPVSLHFGNSILLIFSKFLFSAFFKNFSECFRWFRLLVQTSPVNRITNLPRFFMCLAVICDYSYQTNIRKCTAWLHRESKIQPRGTLCGLFPQTKLQIPN